MDEIAALRAIERWIIGENARGMWLEGFTYSKIPIQIKLINIFKSWDTLELISTVYSDISHSKTVIF